MVTTLNKLSCITNTRQKDHSLHKLNDDCMRCSICINCNKYNYKLN